MHPHLNNWTTITCLSWQEVSRSASDPLGLQQFNILSFAQLPLNLVPRSANYNNTGGWVLIFATTTTSPEQCLRVYFVIIAYCHRLPLITRHPVQRLLFVHRNDECFSESPAKVRPRISLRMESWGALWEREEGCCMSSPPVLWLFGGIQFRVCPIDWIIKMKNLMPPLCC